jgi:hypothetical protein
VVHWLSASNRKLNIYFALSPYCFIFQENLRRSCTFPEYLLGRQISTRYIKFMLSPPPSRLYVCAIHVLVLLIRQKWSSLWCHDAQAKFRENLSVIKLLQGVGTWFHKPLFFHEIRMASRMSYCKSGPKLCRIVCSALFSLRIPVGRLSCWLIMIYSNRRSLS